MGRPPPYIRAMPKRKRFFSRDVFPKRDRYQEKSPPKKLKSFFKQSFASQNTTVNKNYWCGLAGGWHHLVSSSYKALPVPSPIRSSFDTQLSNQDKPRIFDERHRWKGLQPSIISGCSSRVDGSAESERAAAFTPGGRRSNPKRETNKQNIKIQAGFLILLIDVIVTETKWYTQ